MLNKWTTSLPNAQYVSLVAPDMIQRIFVCHICLNYWSITLKKKKKPPPPPKNSQQCNIWAVLLKWNTLTYLDRHLTITAFQTVWGMFVVHIDLIRWNRVCAVLIRGYCRIYCSVRGKKTLRFRLMLSRTLNTEILVDMHAMWLVCITWG